MLDLTIFLTTYAYPLLAVLLGGCALFLTGWLVSKGNPWLQAHAKFLNAQSMEKIQTIEQKAIDAGVQFLMQMAESQGAKVRISVSNPVVRQAAQVALDHAGGALSAAGASPDSVATKILSQLPTYVTTTDTTGAVAHVIPVESAPLPAIGDAK